MPKTNREVQQYMRKLYMEHKISHDDYYLWLADTIRADYSMIPVSDSALLDSTDEYMNDIELHIWDSHDPLVRSLAYSRKLPWSLSDTVCVLKALARKKIKELRKV